MYFIDITGRKFGQLVVLGRAANRGRTVFWRCQCECGRVCEAPGKQLKCGGSRSCGCWRASSREPDEQWAEMLKRRTVSKTDCWEWAGKRSTSGLPYGQVTWKRRYWSVHRLTAHLRLGLAEDSKLCVCHRCDNPPCFNPDHLFLGTYSDNVRDCVAKKRQNESRKTHCPKGHEYAGGNVYMEYGKRKCRACVTERNRIRLANPGIRERYNANRREKTARLRALRAAAS